VAVLIHSHSMAGQIIWEAGNLLTACGRESVRVGGVVPPCARGAHSSCAGVLGCVDGTAHSRHCHTFHASPNSHPRGQEATPNRHWYNVVWSDAHVNSERRQLTHCHSCAPFSPLPFSFSSVVDVTAEELASAQGIADLMNSGKDGNDPESEPAPTTLHTLPLRSLPSLVRSELSKCIHNVRWAQRWWFHVSSHTATHPPEPGYYHVSF
jgi:hypothetical protein